MSTLSQFVGISSQICVNSAVIDVRSTKTVGSTDINSNTPLGVRPSLAGGFVVCKSGGVALIVSPYSSQILGNWDNFPIAIQSAQNCTQIFTGWFIPTVTQLRTSCECRQYWDKYDSGLVYWSSTNAQNCYCGYTIGFSDLTFGPNVADLITRCHLIRAFRCVTY